MAQKLIEKINRRKIQLALGFLWLLDGLLQLQPKMFTAQFMNQVIAKAAEGQPLIVRGPIHFAISIFLTHPAIFNSLIALTQLSIGVLIINKRSVKYGLAASIVWGLFVWYFGEALGGLGSGQTLLLSGAPGAALLYSLLSIGVWPRKADDGQPASWLATLWAVIWLGGAVLQLVAGQNTSPAVAAMVSGMARGAPGWLAALDLHVGHWLGHQANWIVLVAIGVQTLVGGLIFAKKSWRTVTIIAGITVSLVFWVIGQSFGDLYSGLATDLNTAPLIILLGLAVLATKPLELGLT